MNNLKNILYILKLMIKEEIRVMIKIKQTMSKRLPIQEKRMIVAQYNRLKLEHHRNLINALKNQL